jgi:uncharacterized Rmd1/YagE family protein
MRTLHHNVQCSYSVPQCRNSILRQNCGVTLSQNLANILYENINENNNKLYACITILQMQLLLCMQIYKYTSHRTRKR